MNRTAAEYQLSKQEEEEWRVSMFHPFRFLLWQTTVATPVHLSVMLDTQVLLQVNIQEVVEEQGSAVRSQLLRSIIRHRSSSRNNLVRHVI